MRGSEPFTIDDVLERPSLRDALTRLLFEHPKVLELRKAAQEEAAQAGHAFYDWGGLLHGPNDEFLDLRSRDGQSMSNLDELEILWRDSEAPIAKLMLEKTISHRAQDAFSREMQLRAQTLFGSLLGTGRLTAHGLNAVSFQVDDQIPAAVWTHDAFSVRIATGDVLRAHRPTEFGFYVAKMKPQWEAVTLCAGESRHAARLVEISRPVVSAARDIRRPLAAPNARKRGQPPVVFEKLVEKMLADLDAGLISLDDKQLSLRRRYGEFGKPDRRGKQSGQLSVDVVRRALAEVEARLSPNIRQLPITDK